MSIVLASNQAGLDEHPIAIAIRTTDTGGHVGICYRPDESVPLLLHLGFHYQLRNETFRSHYGRVLCPGLSTEEAEDFAGWLAEVWARNGHRIPYGINYWEGAHFASDGTFIPSTDGDGLTCATFVMALFESFKFPLVDASTWPPRADDAQFQQWIVDALDDEQLARVDPNYKQHAEQQKKYVGKAARFRTTEVAYAAAAWNRKLIEFGEAEPGGRAIQEELIEEGL